MTGFWIGAYTASMDGTALGIGLAAVTDDRVEFTGTAVATSSPSALANSGDGSVVYATDEAGRIEAFRRVGDSLEALGGRAVSGLFPCHVSVTVDRLLVSNYGDGSIDVFPLGPDGAIGDLVQSLAGTGSGPREEQGGPHAHSTLVLPLVDGDPVVLSADLGADRVHIHTLVDGLLHRTGSVELPPGTGPRDLLWHDGRVLVLGELDCSLSALEPRGDAFALVATTPLVGDPVDGDHAAALALDPSGRLLYSGLRGSDRIAVVALDSFAPLASIGCGGRWPRHLVVSGDRLLVSNQLSDSIALFRIDPVTGIPALVGTPVTVASPTYLLPVL